MKLPSCYLEHLDSLRLGHAKRLVSCVGLYILGHIVPFCVFYNLGLMFTDKTRLYRSNILVLNSVLLRVSALYISHHQVGIRSLFGRRGLSLSYCFYEPITT